MIRKLKAAELSLAAEVVRESFATVAKDFGLNEQNCPKFTGFFTTAERLRNHYKLGRMMYGLFENGRLVGYVSMSREGDGYELHSLAVLPDRRHKGYGRRLLDHCKAKVKELGGSGIVLSIIEENAVLKRWHEANGFVHTGVKRFEHLPFTVGYMRWEG